VRVIGAAFEDARCRFAERAVNERVASVCTQRRVQKPGDERFCHGFMMVPAGMFASVLFAWPQLSTASPVFFSYFP
jgi:hypothetical protein